MPNTLRSCIVAEQGYTFLALDASQIELRVLAILSGDPQMLEDLQTSDLHMATAIRMFGWTDDEEVTARRRYKAKQGNFALVYEASEFKLAEMLECSIEEALSFMADHRKTYPVLYQWMDDTKAKVKKDGFTVNLFGRIRPIPELNAGTQKQRAHAERKIINTIIQSTAVDICKLMGLYLKRLFDPQVRLVLQVHDEWLWECPDRFLQQTIEQCDELKGAFPDYPVSISIGRCYGELRSIDNE